MERIDKVLSNMGFGSRREIKDKIKNKTVFVDGTMVKDPGLKVDPYEARMVIEGEEVYYKYKDKIGETVTGVLEIKNYEDGIKRFDIISLS